MTRPLRVRFVDFWHGFDLKTSLIYRVLSKIVPIRLLEDDKAEADLIVYSCMGQEHKKYDAVKLFFSGENTAPNFNECDYAISSCPIHLGNRHFRLPLYLCYHDFQILLERSKTPQAPLPLELAKREFCSVVVSNNFFADPIRNEFWKRLNQYKTLASGGRYANNVGEIGAGTEGKLAFIANYKFNLAFENSAVDGYVTEKIVQPATVHSVPIYWGSPSVAEELNPKAFINIQDFSSLDEALEYIIEVDNDDDRYMAYLNENLVQGTPFADYEMQLRQFLEREVLSLKRYVSSYGHMGCELYNWRETQRLENVVDVKTKSKKTVKIDYRVLSLEKDKERRALFFAQDQSKYFEVFSAINKDDPVVDQRFDIEKGNASYWNKRFSRGEIACTLSHLAMYKEFVNNSDAQWLVICEDDAVLSPDFEILPEILSQNYDGFDCYIFNAYKGEDFNASGRQVAALTIEHPMQYFPHRYGRFSIGRIYRNYHCMTVGYAINRRMATRILAYYAKNKAYWVADDFRTLLEVAGYQHNAIAHIQPRLVKEDPRAVSNLEQERNIENKQAAQMMDNPYPLVTEKQYRKLIKKLPMRRLKAFLNKKIL